jgi:F-type H+-transporting ATPase subunit alpha
MNAFIIEKLKKEIENLRIETAPETVGVVTGVGDGIAEIDGLADAELMEMVVFETDAGRPLSDTLGREGVLYGLVLNLEEDAVRVVILGATERVSEGMRVARTKKLLSIPVSEAMLGRVISPLGEAMDGKGNLPEDTLMSTERVAYGVMDRASVSEPIHTGIKAIDAMIPIGRGQRELIIGDRGTGKTTIAVDAIINQKHEPENKRPICVYVAVGQKRSKTAALVAKLAEAGALSYTVVVATSASEASPMLFLAPFSGVAIGEYFMRNGKDVLIVFDDLSKHANAYRQMSLLLRRPPGREAYPGDIFYLHSRLLERAAKLNEKLGGGSITALPIIETKEGDVSAYIPTNVISITDGQIFLDGDIFNKGIRPALNVGLSVSRVGSAAQTKAMKKVAGKMRLELAQFRELEAFVQFASDLDDETKKRIENGRKYVELLKQPPGAPMPFYLQVISIFAANHGLFDGSAVEAVRGLEEAFLDYVEREHRAVMDAIAVSRELSDETAATLTAAIAAFKESHRDRYDA